MAWSAFVRKKGNEEILVLINLTNRITKVQVDVPAPDYAQARDLLKNGALPPSLSADKFSCQLGAFDYVVAKRARGEVNEERMRFITSLIVAGLSLWPVGIGLAQPTTQFNVKNFGAAGDGVQPDTEAINKAIEAARDAGGGTVLVPAGNYVSGTIQLQNNVTLWLDAGATILGTKNLADYHWPEGGREWDGSMVLANGVHNVALMGRGTISGQNLMNPRGEERIRGPHAVLFNNSKDIVVRDITIKDAGNYSLILRSCERVNIDNFTAYNGYDGINMHDVRHATISNSKLYTGDDSLAGAYWENVTVTNCILNSSCNAIRVGGRNVLINNCLIYGPGQYAHRLGFRTNTESGFQILPHSAGRGNAPPGRLVTPGPIDNMVLSNITMINVRSPVYIAFGADAPYSGNNLGVGRIVIENLTAINCGRTPFYVAGPNEKPAKSIILRNARMTFVGGVNDEESNGQGFSPYSMIQAYGVYGRNVENLELHDVRVDYRRQGPAARHLRREYRHAGTGPLRRATRAGWRALAALRWHRQADDERRGSDARQSAH